MAQEMKYCSVNIPKLRFLFSCLDRKRSSTIRTLPVRVLHVLSTAKMIETCRKNLTVRKQQNKAFNLVSGPPAPPAPRSL